MAAEPYKLISHFYYFLIRLIGRITGQLIDYQNKLSVMAVNRLKYLISINRMIDMS